MSRKPKTTRTVDEYAAAGRREPRKYEASRTDALRVILAVRSRQKPVRASSVAEYTGLHTHVVHAVLTEAQRHLFVQRTSRKWDRWTRGRASDVAVNDAYRPEVILALESHVERERPPEHLARLMTAKPRPGPGRHQAEN